MASSGPRDGTVFTNYDVGGLNWTNPDNAVSADAVYATFAVDKKAVDDTQILYASGFGFTIPSDATINGIFVEWKKKYAGTGGSVTDSSINLFDEYGDPKGSENSVAWTTTNQYANYGSSTSLWNTTWTPAQINDADFGAGLSAIVYGGATVGCTAYIDHVRITVYYTEAAGGGSQVRLLASTGVGI